MIPVELLPPEPGIGAIPYTCIGCPRANPCEDCPWAISDEIEPPIDGQALVLWLVIGEAL